jgi:hypothetical protein
MAGQVFTNCTNGGPVFVYARDGKITRVPNLSAEIYPFAEESRWAAIADGSRSGSKVEILSKTKRRDLFSRPLGVFRFQ